jgi:oxygen-independent coproporphyrinogen III oxidase
MILMRGVATEEQAKAEDAGPLGLYVHVPFCATHLRLLRVLPGPSDRRIGGGFHQQPGAEARLVDWNRPLATVFWGGGTPGLLAPADLGRLAEVVHAIPGGPRPASGRSSSRRPR